MLLHHLVRSGENETDKGIINHLEEVAKKLGKSMAAVAVAWSLKKGVNPILGLASKERIDETMEMIRFELAEEDLKCLEESYQPKHVAFVG